VCVESEYDAQHILNTEVAPLDYITASKISAQDTYVYCAGDIVQSYFYSKS
jgi:hypothetical protein